MNFFGHQPKGSTVIAPNTRLPGPSAAVRPPFTPGTTPPRAETSIDLGSLVILRDELVGMRRSSDPGVSEYTLVYLRGREEPVIVPMTFEAARAAWGH